MEVSRRLVASGVEVEVLCADSEGSRLLRTRHQGVPIRLVRGRPASRDYYWAPRIWSQMSRGRSWDVIHVQSYHTLVPPLAMLRALSLHTPYVLTFHSGGNSSRLRHRLRGLQRRAQRPLLARAARLVAVAQFEIDRYSEELNLPRERFVLIPNGIDVQLHPPSLDGTGEAAQGRTVLASIGRLERYKGHHRAIEALVHVLPRRPDACLLIVGEGPHEGELRRQAAELGVESRVRFTSLPADDRVGMAELLREASVVVLLSEYETHPLTALEAVAAGRPLVVLDRAGLSEVARAGLARPVASHDPPEAVATTILEELEHPLERPETKLFSWDDCTAALLELYRSIC